MKYALIIALLFVAQLSGSAQDKLSQLRTSKQIITVDQVSAPYYAIQILALKLPPNDAGFFRNLDEVREFPCTDGYVRYCVGSYNSFAEANADLQSVRDKGYSEAFVANIKRFELEPTEGGSDNSSLTIYPNRDYVVQLAAFRYPVYLNFFENVDEVYEYRLNDKIFRYTTAPCKGSEVRELQQEMKSKGYKNAFIVEYSRYSPFRIE